MIHNALVQQVKIIAITADELWSLNELPRPASEDGVSEDPSQDSVFNASLRQVAIEILMGFSSRASPSTFEDVSS